ncbi:MAG TPA: FHA domain-containing protein [Polyangiaceae bacterium]|nr:FHA domain-containing protein [Polyangiaceae bacterium]
MALTVIVRSGDLIEAPSITFDAPRIVLGRGASSDILLPDPSVSLRHASIRQRGADYVVIDEGSTNGTFVGPVRLAPQAPRVLLSGDLVRVGRVWLELRIESVPPTISPQTRARELARTLVEAALLSDGRGGTRVRVRDGSEAPPELAVGPRERSYIVGRGLGPDLSIDDPELARRHLQIRRHKNGIWVKDLSGKLPVQLGERPLAPNQEEVWTEGTVLHVGKTQLICEDPVRAALAELESCEDEHMLDDDSVDPPPAVRKPAAPVEVPKRAPSRRSAQPEPVLSPGEIPVRQAPPPKPRERMWLLDWLVAFVALAVLSLSLLGIWMLFRV